MTTPQGPPPPHGNPAEQPAWGNQPPGGWGEQQRDQGSETAVWNEQAAAQQGPPGQWGGPQNPQGGSQNPQGGYPQGGPQYPPPGQQGGWGPQPTPQWQGGPQPPPGAPWQGGQPQPQPQWGQQGYPPLPQGPTRPRRSPMPFIVGGIVVVAAAVVAFLGFVAPGFFRTTVFDQGALQGGVQRVLTETYQIEGVGPVTCGDPAAGPIRVRAGDTFTCTTTIDGASATIPVRITSDDGAYEVSRPVS